MLRIIIALILLFSVSVLYAEFSDKIIAVVNDEVITQSDIDQILSPLYMEYSSLYPADELKDRLAEAREKIISRLIEDRLIFAEAKRQKIEVTDEEIEGRTEEIKAQFPSPEAFEEELAAQGVTLSELKKKYREQIMIRKVLDREVRAKVIVNPTDVTRYYQANIDKFKEPLQVKVSHILIRVDNEENQAERHKQAERILALLRSGNNFAELAGKYSEGPRAKEGGDMGFISQGQMLKEIDGVIFNLEAGEISDVVRTKIGYHIFKVEDKREERIKTLFEVQSQIENILNQQGIQQRFQEWIERLKGSAYIVIY